jgi:FAD/FMN-containing dehydrogenase
MFDRRTFLTTAGHWLTSAGLFLIGAGCARRRSVPSDPLLVNDLHSGLNPTRVDQIVAPGSLEEVQGAVQAARQGGKAVCIAGGRHAMGGQQFAEGAVMVDTRKLARVLKLDAEKGLVEVEAGIQWPQLVEHLVRVQAGRPKQWGIRQKQTGADRLCLGGALSANVHGRGLRMKPIIDDVEAFVLVDAEGKTRICSRTQHPELFRLAIGGYGLFGIIASVTLRLAPRQRVQRVVEIQQIDRLMPAFERRIRDGFVYGDFQFATDEKSPLFLRQGVFSCYRPVPPETPTEEEPRRTSAEDWQKLVALAHKDKERVYQIYTKSYLSTNGKLYWSDTHQLGTYVDGYHQKVDEWTDARHPTSEIITEIYLPRPALVEFMEAVSADFRKNRVNLIYGTIRLIEQDDESFLAWAKQPYVGVIFNLHTEHTPEGEKHSADAFRRLIDMAIRRGGSYYLTYHRYATREQVEACYPQFPEFLRLKRQYDPEERFQSDWYRHYKKLFA